MQKIVICSFLLLQLALLQTSDCLPTPNDEPEVLDKPENKFDADADTVMPQAPPAIPHVLTSVSTQRSNEKTCSDIGQYCSQSEQCCTKRCLTYARKCVT